MATPRSRSWCFTLNNPVEAIAFDAVTMKYLIYQKEIAPTTQTPHFQGFVIFKNPRAKAGVRALLPTAHWEITIRSAEENIAYCSKEPRAEPTVEAGVRPAQGTSAKWQLRPTSSRVRPTRSLSHRSPFNSVTPTHSEWGVGDAHVGGGGHISREQRVNPRGLTGKRTDIETVLAAVEDGTPELEIARTMPQAWARNLRAIDRFKRLITEPRNEACKTTVFWGPPGSGKSSRARDLAPDAYWVSRGNSGTVWFDGYEAQSEMIIDEFYGWISRDMMQRLSDRYPLMLQIKGEARQCCVVTLVITSNQHPLDWWKIGLGAMQRRLEPPNGDIIYVDYSAEFPCVTCHAYPHGPTCDFKPSGRAPAGASVGPKAVMGYVGEDGGFIPI